MNWADDDAVTPVVGTVLILMITMAGIGAVLSWGVPAVQGIQDQSSSSTMSGEFSDARENTLILREVDTSRIAPMSVVAGELSVELGSRFAFHAVHDINFPSGQSRPNCDIRVTGWHSTSDTLAIETSNCGDIVSGSPGTFDDLEIKLDKLVGSSIQSRPSYTFGGGGNDATVQSIGDDFSTGDWRIRLIDSSEKIHAQAFIIGTSRLAWHLQSSVSDLHLYLEGGALFKSDGPQFFNLASVPVNENVFGTRDYLLVLPTYSGPITSIGSPYDPVVFLQLQGNHARVAGTETLRLRFDVAGDLAESWCNHFVFRNDAITAGEYAEDASATCETGDANGVRSLTYEPTGGAAFPFEFIHKRVHVGITV